MDEGPLNIANDDIHSDRISGQFVNDKVINLSNRALSDIRSVLRKQNRLNGVSYRVGTNSFEE